MPTVDVYTASGSASRRVDLSDEVFGVAPNVPAMHQVVVAQLAAARRGTSKVKSRGEVRGGGKKPWRQKGTGRARQGSIRAPHWAGGGVAHGPSGEQNHTKRVNKKLKQVALRSALSDRAAAGDLRVLEDLGFEAPKTSEAVGVLDALGVRGRKVLLVLARRDEVVAKSFRNLPDVHILTVDQLNTYDVLCSDVVLLQEEAVDYVGTGTRPDLTTQGGRTTKRAAVAARARGAELTGAVGGAPEAPPEEPATSSSASSAATQTLSADELAAARAEAAQEPQAPVPADDQEAPAPEVPADEDAAETTPAVDAPEGDPDQADDLAQPAGETDDAGATDEEDDR